MSKKKKKKQKKNVVCEFFFCKRRFVPWRFAQWNLIRCVRVTFVGHSLINIFLFLSFFVVVEILIAADVDRLWEFISIDLPCNIVICTSEY